MPKKETCELVRDAHEAVGKHVKPKSAIVDCKKKASYGIQFRVVDAELNPIHSRDYVIRLADGKKVEGKTEPDGLTQIVKSDKAETVSISVCFMAPKRMISFNEFESPVSFTLVKIKDDEVSIESVKINDKAATREAIIRKLKESGISIKTRSEWRAEPSKAKADWDFSKIALHHAGNSYSCGKDALAQLKDAEQTDTKTFGHISYHYAIACSGEVYEALDIRFKGAHISRGNTGNIGIVLLADLSESGEAFEQEYSKKGIIDTEGRGWGERFKKSIKNLAEVAGDKVDIFHDKAPTEQVQSLSILVDTLLSFFKITQLGGHREFQVLSTGEGRACPGEGGMLLVKNLRKSTGLMKP